MNIPGLPEGVECVRIGRAKPEDFEIIGFADRHCIAKGTARSASLSQVIVRPAAGWQFVPIIDGSLEFAVIKTLDPPVEIVVTAKFSVTNSRDQQTVTDAAAALATLPGYVVP